MILGRGFESPPLPIKSPLSSIFLRDFFRSYAVSYHDLPTLSLIVGLPK